MKERSDYTGFGRDLDDEAAEPPKSRAMDPGAPTGLSLRREFAGKKLSRTRELELLVLDLLSLLEGLWPEEVLTSSSYDDMRVRAKRIAHERTSGGF